MSFFRLGLITFCAFVGNSVSGNSASGAKVHEAGGKMAISEKVALHKGNWWPQQVGRALNRAAGNRPQILAALRRVPLSQRASLQFLLLNMPQHDLRTLKAGFLLEHIALIHQSFAQAPWKTRIPRDIFLNDVLPYASLNETRDDSFAALRARARPLIIGARTPGAAAQLLNQKLFSVVKVRYSTGRKRADQSPQESMSSGLASCSGLSILLVDACRAVGVPARVVGTPLWANGRGNHTWVEIWDNGWHFLGAAEPDEQGLNRGWFVADAAQARRDVPQNAIYASSFRRTGLSFPLVWAPEIRWVNAVNVTQRYAQKPQPNSSGTRVLLQVLADDGQRVATRITISKPGENQPLFSGQSRGENADKNDFLAVELAPGSYSLTVGQGAAQYVKTFTVKAQTEQLETLGLKVEAPLWSWQPTYVSPPVSQPLPMASAAQLRTQISQFFAATPQAQTAWKFSQTAEQLLRANEAAVRQIAWQSYRAAPIHGARKSDFDAKQVRFETHLSPYTVREVGVRPADGWGLVIAMHGGGGTAKEVNDSQWAGMARHYRDHPQNGGYLYLALRAPNDTWNGFYDDYVYPLVGNLIRQFTVWGEVNPNKVFLMGYSHGGYGAFAIGPKMPDRFAAIHASAAAPTDGETAPKNLRNTVFSAMVGERDTMYDRLERVRRFGREIEQLRGQRRDIYPVSADVMLGFEHGNLQDRDKIAEMSRAVRHPVPRELTWLQTDSVIRDFYWLGTNTPAKTREISATCRNNQLVINSGNSPAVTVFLDNRLMDFSKPLQIEINGRKSQRFLAPSLRTLCETLQHRGDPELAFTAQIELSLMP